ncbi:unnamed protein product [Lymnaea stagnalis]|uniref:AB hydrolase-1 domain-containing protein n=1 Tax=Lymnaea stagnalis TaxID=6523 RepID=A0AAV2IJ25_LYMST
MNSSHVCPRLLVSKFKSHLLLLSHFQKMKPRLTPHNFYSWYNSSHNLLLKHRHSAFSSFCTLRTFSSSSKAFLFWKETSNLTPSFQKVKTTSNHDGKTLVDRYIFVKTLDHFYEDVPNGIILDTAYADSRPGEDFDKNSPVILGLHDTPGSHHDLLPILGTFAKLGCRTVAPTFPGHGDTQGLMPGFDDIFSHSTSERSQFVHNFLADLGIERVDIIIALGAACYPAMRLCAGGDTNDFYRSMALISPWPLKRSRYEAHVDLSKKIQFLWDRPFLRPPAKLLLPVCKVGNVKNTRDKVTTAYLLNNLDLNEATGLALAAGIMNMPRFVMFGEQDHDVEKELYYDLVNKLEIPRANVSMFEGKLGSPLLPGALVFPEGGYDLLQKYSGIISICLLDLLKLFYPNIRI